MDEDGDGQISMAEMIRHTRTPGIGKSFFLQGFDLVKFREADTNNDGNISWDEFFHYLVENKMIDSTYVLRRMIDEQQEAHDQRVGNRILGMVALGVACLALVVALRK